MGGVYCLGESEGTTVSNNVIHHVYSFDYGGWGLYTDEGSTGIVMENNLVYECKNSGFHQHYGKENIIRNNIFVNNLKAQLQATRVEEHLSFTFTNNIVWFSSGDLLSSNWDKINLQSDYNCYRDTRTEDVRFKKMTFAEWQKSGKDVHSIIADPGFADPAANDFRIKNKMVLRKTGFKEFDYSKAGVYGTEEWKKLAAFDQAVARRFDGAIYRNENRKQ
jgi:parallel beta-helix repeat protein